MRALELGKVGYFSGPSVSPACFFLSVSRFLPVYLAAFPICFSVLICHNIDVSCNRQHLFSLLSACCFLFLIVSLNTVCSQGELSAALLTLDPDKSCCPHALWLESFESKASRL